MVLGLLLGLILVVASIRLTRWQSRRLRPDPDAARALESTLWGVSLVLAALIYIGFALREDGEGWMLVELAGLLVYSALALAGARHHSRWLAAGWALHAAWDLLVHHGVPDSFVPQWYRWACVSFDLGAAWYLLKLHRPRPGA